jgi:hypothetical protein
MPTAENIESFGYTMLQQPIEGLNIIYPDERLTPTSDLATLSFNSHDLIGAEGLKRVMSFTENETTKARTNFKYKNYGKIFSKEEIGKYSSKIKTICDQIVNSTGVILVYSQYIDAGLVPLALALEERGFSRAGDGKSLFDKPPVPPVKGFKYVMITGDKGFSPNPQNDIKMATNDDNKNGEKVKVIMISQTGAEGLDLKCIRQVHIIEPWYNMNRIEQIIGRAIRTCSHKTLPFLKRNVEIYLYGSLMSKNGEEEAVDLYIYRLAETKAIQIGKVSRVIKAISVDCILNRSQMSFTEEEIEKKMLADGVTAGITLDLANGNKLPNYKIGDKPFSAICDYMESCAYTCAPDKAPEDMVINTDTYSEDFIMMNTDKLVNQIKRLMKDRYFYRKRDLVMLLNVLKPNPEDQINAALQHLLEDKNEYISDEYGRLGHLVNIDDLYLFQPLELSNKRASIYDKQTPLDWKNEKVIVKMPKGMMKSMLPMKTVKTVMKTKKTVTAEGQEQTEEAEGEDLEGEDLEGEEQAQAEQAQAEQAQAEQAEENLEDNALFKNIRTNYETVSTLVVPEPPLPMKGKQAQGKQIDIDEKNWYKYCYSANRWMIANGTAIAREVLLGLVVEHIVDDLTSAEIYFLLNHIETRDGIYETDDLFKQVKSYILKQTLEGNNKNKGFLWNNQDKQVIFVKSPKEAQWRAAEAEDIKDLKTKIDEKKTKLITNLNNNMGFMLSFKKENYNVFKTKDITKTRDLGARCDQYSNKKSAIALLNTIIGQDLYSTTEKITISQKDICIIQELYLRMFHNLKKNNKYWFLNPAESVLTNIEKYSSSK